MKESWSERTVGAADSELKQEDTSLLYASRLLRMSSVDARSVRPVKSIFTCVREKPAE